MSKGKTNIGIIDCAVYENGSEYLGLANVKLMDLAKKTFTVSGFGIGGDVEYPVPGHYAAMEVELTFTDAPEASRKSVTHGRHTLELRVARENFDSTKGKYERTGHRYVVDLVPLSEALGTLAPASQQGVSNKYACHSLMEYINDKLVRHVEPENMIDIDADGNDSMADVRRILGR